jgi:hypothetical protein
MKIQAKDSIVETKGKSQEKNGKFSFCIMEKYSIMMPV